MQNNLDKSNNDIRQIEGNLDALTQEKATTSNAIEIPAISLPKGGGALKGIDEKFQVNGANGTASFSIPFPISPGRNGFEPSLALNYNSGNGNSPFGLGWSIDLPSIKRKTDKKIPKYQDAEEEDVYMFSGSEDLVPFLIKNEDGEYIPKEETTLNGYTVKRYRPRVEGSFSRIEKITHSEHGTYWKVTTRSNIATIFGRDPKARIADPSDPKRIFQWMPEFSYDDKGNWIQYHHKNDINTHVDPLLNRDESIPNTVYNKNRKNGNALYTNTYLKRVTYGNRRAYYANTETPYDPQEPNDPAYFFELVLDYGEHNAVVPTPIEETLWNYREDPFSSYRSAFEIRTNRLCSRILMFHHFGEEKQFTGTTEEEEFGENYLVRSLELHYEPSDINFSGDTEITYLQNVIQCGYIRKPDGTYSVKKLPPIEFTYQKLHWNHEVRTVSPDQIVNAPVGITNNYQWIDLYGEGISGILTEQGEGWYYKNNLGDVDDDGNVAFTVGKKVIPRPSYSGLSNGVLSIQDLEANGKKQVVVNSDQIKGYFELTEDDNWKPFTSFEQIVNIDIQNPNIRFLDINGDGQPELVLTEENVFRWYASKGKKGYLPPETTFKALNEEQGPAIVFSDIEQAIFLADMVGDGLTDIVRIRNGEICYWANMGYGKFSAKITMANAPIFDHPASFNPAYLHITDISGTGASDIMYLGKNAFQVYVNLSGNSWSEVHEIEPFFPIDNTTQVSVIDFLGKGTPCIVWSSDLPLYKNTPMRYIDIMNGKKPHILISYKNNFGKETSISYKSSTHFYLKDKIAGNPWVTKLPFPVQVVNKVTVQEKITDVRFTTEYQYHHGYYDHKEREFRGFGLVEQVDTEIYAEWSRNNDTNALEKEETLFQKPIVTKSWYHTGAFMDREQLLTHYKKEHWLVQYNNRFPEDTIDISEPELEDARLYNQIGDWNIDTYEEALRACKGMLLRQEVFALDAPENPTDDELKLQMKPFTVATHNCNIIHLQPKKENGYAVFLVTESEAITIHYERDESDPRISHTLNSKLDEFGNILERVTVVYGRDQQNATTEFQELSDGVTDFSEDTLDNNVAQRTQLANAFQQNINTARDTQTKTHITYTKNTFSRHDNGVEIVDDIDTPQVYRVRLPYEEKVYEITGMQSANRLFLIEEFDNILTTATEIEYHEVPTTGVQIRLIEHLRTRYLKDDLTILDFGFYDALALPYENYQLAYTSNLINDIYVKQDNTELQLDGEVASNLIQSQGNYSLQDGKLWIRSGIPYIRIDETENLLNVQTRFYSPIAFEDPSGALTTVAYDTETFTGDIRNNDGYYLFIRETQDAVDNKVQLSVFNYRTLSPLRIMDTNANPSSIILNELGLVKATAIEGNGSYTDETRTAVMVIDTADNLSGITEYTEESETNTITQLLATSDYQGTNTVQLRILGNQLLNRATTYFLYDFDAYQNSGIEPTMAMSITREEHFEVNNNAMIRFVFEYTNGSGNVILEKTQAEPGLAYYMEAGIRIQKDTGTDIRWIGTGRKILNNKGHKVKQYEPYFSTNFQYENDEELVETGVTSIHYYDPLGRQIKTELPDGTYIKTEFDSWKQKNFDNNDTVLESSWYLDRINNRIDAALLADGKDPEKEKQAAEKTSLHANTPLSQYLDALGRSILSVANNGKDSLGGNKLYTTMVQLDIEGNTKTVTDARGNQVVRYAYNMLGHRVYHHSMDSGEKWVLTNVLGNPIYSWDDKDQVFRTNYDVLQRPIEQFLHASGNSFLIEKMKYGEDEVDASIKNLQGQLYEQYDSSGRITNREFDFKGNLLEAQRQLAASYQSEVIDWSDGAPTNQLETETFIAAKEYDALNRMTRHYNWYRTDDNVSVYEPSYNERGVLVSEEHITAAERTVVGYIGGRRIVAVSQVMYNEKGQRTQMRYGNGTTTKYHYDPNTYRLIQLRTTRNSMGDIPTSPSNLTDPNVLQNIYYTYDPVGNVIIIEDDAYEPVFFNNQMVEPRSQYTYDSLYRLVEATGRENNTFNNAPQPIDVDQIISTFPITDQTLRNYTQLYTYDPLGNILFMRHVATTERWTRRYAYANDSNRLDRTWIGNDLTTTINYQYDRHGNIENYNNTPNEYVIQWDYDDRVHHMNLGGGGESFYQYDGSKERSRKRIQRDGNITEERLYLGGMEVYRRWNGIMLVEEIETHHLFLDDQRILIVENILQTDNNQLSTGILDRYQYSNHIGSVGLEMDGGANIISYEEYHPFGTTAYQAKNTAISATAKQYRYTGMERDHESGLQYHSARYYIPWLGRWLSADPIGIGGGINVYVYTKNNPLIWVDKAGTQPTPPDEDQDPTPSPEPATEEGNTSETEPETEEPGEEEPLNLQLNPEFLRSRILLPLHPGRLVPFANPPIGLQPFPSFPSVTPYPNPVTRIVRAIQEGANEYEVRASSFTFQQQEAQRLQIADEEAAFRFMTGQDLETPELGATLRRVGLDIANRAGFIDQAKEFALGPFLPGTIIGASGYAIYGIAGAVDGDGSVLTGVLNNASSIVPEIPIGDTFTLRFPGSQPIQTDTNPEGPAEDIIGVGLGVQLTFGEHTIPAAAEGGEPTTVPIHRFRLDTNTRFNTESFGNTRFGATFNYEFRFR